MTASHLEMFLCRLSNRLGNGPCHQAVGWNRDIRLALLSDKIAHRSNDRPSSKHPLWRAGHAGETFAVISELKPVRSESCSKTRFFEGHHGVAVWCHGLLYTSSLQFLQHQASRLSCVLRLRFSPASGAVGVSNHQVLVHMKDLL